MYTEHFGLNEKPFSISPDPRYLYLSQRHADALAHLLYGISESGGFIQLTGEVGTGKTTLIRCLLDQLPAKTEIALILNPQLSTKQFLQAICQELRIPMADRDTAKALIDKLNVRLLELHAENRRVVLIVDEAQTMSPELLEQVRLLTNLETPKQKLLQIILIGQPELRAVLDQPNMRQIAQRITGRYHLEPLNAADAGVYVAHRMRVAGGRPEIFGKRAIRKLFRLSRGVPRLINIIADRALLAAYARDEVRIRPGLIGQAASEVFGRTRPVRWWPWAAAVAAIVLMLWVSALDDAGPPDTTLALALVETEPVVATPTEPEAPIATLDASADEAMADLFGIWGAEYLPGTDPCESAAEQMLRCLKLSNAPIAELRQLDRPVRLELVMDDGQRKHLVLKGIDSTHAAVVVAGQVRHTPIAELTLYAQPDQLLLFRPAVSDPSGALAEGARGPGVIWLRTTLDSVAGLAPESAEPDLFDAALTDAVRAYQRDRGLFVDGLVGDRTLIALQNEIGLVGASLMAGMH